MAALTDLVESGVNLLNTVDCLLKDIQMLGDVDINSKILSYMIHNLKYNDYVLGVHRMCTRHTQISFTVIL